jgi:integrase/recombinase XerC
MIDSFLNYLQYEKRCSPHTLTSYQTDLAQFHAYLKDAGEFKEPELADFLSVRGWIVSLVDGGISPKSVNRKIATLRAFYKYLLKKGVVSHDPTLKVKSLKVGKPLPPFVEESRLNQVLDTFDFPADFSGIRDRLVMELLYGTGIRLSEMIGLRDGRSKFGGTHHQSDRKTEQTAHHSHPRQPVGPHQPVPRLPKSA